MATGTAYIKSRRKVIVKVRAPRIRSFSPRPCLPCSWMGLRDEDGEGRGDGYDEAMGMTGWRWREVGKA